MELYYHKTDGGAEYYQTDPTDIGTTVLRTDGAELKIMSLEQLKRAGFKSVVFNGERYDLQEIGTGSNSNEIELTFGIYNNISNNYASRIGSITLRGENMEVIVKKAKDFINAPFEEQTKYLLHTDRVNVTEKPTHIRLETYTDKGKYTITAKRAFFKERG